MPSDGAHKPMGWSPQAPCELRRVRTRNFAGCEPEISQGATPKLRRVRTWNFAGCEVGTSQGAKLRHRRVRSWDIAGCEVATSQGAKCWSRSGGFLWLLPGRRRRWQGTLHISSRARESIRVCPHRIQSYLGKKRVSLRCVCCTPNRFPMRG